MNDVIKNRETWINALRSDEYQQAQGALTDGTGFCCLGVACDLYHKATGNGEWLNGEFVTRDANGRQHLDDAVPPAVVVEWLGLNSESGEYTISSEEGDLFDEQSSLVDLNDSGDYTFKQIADIIASNPVDLFKS